VQERPQGLECARSGAVKWRARSRKTFVRELERRSTRRPVERWSTELVPERLRPKGARRAAERWPAGRLRRVRLEGQAARGCKASRRGPESRGSKGRGASPQGVVPSCWRAGAKGQGTLPQGGVFGLLSARLERNAARCRKTACRGPWRVRRSKDARRIAERWRVGRLESGSKGRGASPQGGVPRCRRARGSEETRRAVARWPVVGPESPWLEGNAAHRRKTACRGPRRVGRRERGASPKGDALIVSGRLRPEGARGAPPKGGMPSGSGGFGSKERGVSPKGDAPVSSGGSGSKEPVASPRGGVFGPGELGPKERGRSPKGERPLSSEGSGSKEHVA
jgi:hypothetical protein